MDSTSNSQIRANALEIIKNFRVPDLQVKKLIVIKSF
jgi:hypothetical protein